jgi:RNA polymerase sigma-70 factor, ECF subfamily
MPENGLDVAACVRRVLDGDEEAARLLLEHLYPLVLKLVRARRPRRTDEEDMVQIIFAKMFAKLEQYSGTVPLEHWVSRIAVNTCLNQIDRERIRPELRWADLTAEEEQVLHTFAATAPELLPSHGLAARELVEKLLAQLNPADQLVITLIHLEGRSVEEVRAVTGWNAALVKIRAFRARQKMKKHLNLLLRERKS